MKTLLLVAALAAFAAADGVRIDSVSLVGSGPSYDKSVLIYMVYNDGRVEVGKDFDYQDCYWSRYGRGQPIEPCEVARSLQKAEAAKKRDTAQGFPEHKAPEKVAWP